MILSNSNAYLRYSGGTFPLWVMGLEQIHELAGSTAQAKTYQHFYPRSYFPGAMMITGRVRNQKMYDDLAEFIRGHQLALVNNPVLESGLSGSLTNRPGRETIPLLEFNFPEENLLLTGWITPFEAGAKRFNVAPEYTLTFVIASDRHSTNDSINASFAVRGWWSGAFLDFDLNGPINSSLTTKDPKSKRVDVGQYKWPDTPPDPAQLSAAPLLVQLASGSGGGTGGGGGGGDYSAGNISEVPSAYHSAIAARAEQIDPGGAAIKALWPNAFPSDPNKQYYASWQNNQAVAVNNGQRQIYIKYRNPPNSSNTVWVTIG